MADNKRVDMTSGPVAKGLLAFALPIILGNLLQQLYGAADRLVVGQFAENGATALAAVGATSAPINLIIGLFTGLATGVNVICANLLGSRDTRQLRKSMHTAVVVGLLCGAALAVFGWIAAPVILSWMDTPESVMPLAIQYMRIYFVGVPASLLYNFLAGILRAHGDTKRPMYILMFSGLVNVALNLVFVIVFHMGVAGVAIATAVSQYLSAMAVLYIVFSPKDQYRLRLQELGIDQRQLMSIVRVGIPSGLGGIVFSFSNVILQSSLNSFNSDAVIAAKTIAVDVNALIYQIQAGLAAACVSFSGQCYGAGNYKRIDKVAGTATLLCLSLAGVPVVLCSIFAPQVVSLFNTDPEVIRYGIPLLLIMVLGMFVYAPAELYMGCTRGMKRAMAPTLMNMLGICLPRLIWIWVVFPLFRDVVTLYLCYPISWGISAVLQVSYYYHVRRKMNRETTENV